LPPPSATACPACKGPVRGHGWKHDHELHQCVRCGTLSSVAASAPAALYERYYDRAVFELPRPAAESLERLVRACAPFRVSGRWLDVGFGEGGLLETAARLGWSCFGSELSPRALEHGARRGFCVSARPEEDARFPCGGFDVVTMVEFLEHVADPDPFLASAARWLRPGGLLFATTPNRRSLNCLLLGLRWSVISPPEHCVIWTAAGLRAALGRAGFACRSVRAEGLNPAEILAALRPRGSTAPVSRNEAGFALNAALSATPRRRALKRAANHVLSLLCCGDTLKVWAIRSEAPAAVA
jgi:SAM-dependent methyltransferase